MMSVKKHRCAFWGTARTGKLNHFFCLNHIVVNAIYLF
ncbi:hypothetical protein D083_1558 [Dickeya solani RNS 08.23.3.1.A]|nr:hypothetical protein D083_1558 [Dickeya solani RNS 08.23.3.1.A]